MKWIRDGAFWEIPVALYPLPAEGKRLPLRAGRDLPLALGAVAVTTAFKWAQIAGYRSCTGGNSISSCRLQKFLYLTPVGCPRLPSVDLQTGKCLAFTSSQIS